jgi:hypothetical protein
MRARSSSSTEPPIDADLGAAGSSGPDGQVPERAPVTGKWPALSWDVSDLQIGPWLPWDGYGAWAMCLFSMPMFWADRERDEPPPPSA